MTLAYLATPFSKIPDRYEAFAEAARIAGELLKRGVHVFCPIANGHVLSVYGNVVFDTDLPWYDYNRKFMDFCDSLLVAQMPGWAESAGIDFEVQYFMCAKKPIFDLDPKTLAMTRRGLWWEAVA